MRITVSPVEKIFRETLPEKLPHYEVREQQIEMALIPTLTVGVLKLLILSHS